MRESDLHLDLDHFVSNYTFRKRRGKLEAKKGQLQLMMVAK